MDYEYQKERFVIDQMGCKSKGEVRLYQKKEAARDSFSSLDRESTRKETPGRLAVVFLYDLSRNYHVAPSVFYTGGNRMLTLMFPGISFVYSDFCYQYGELLASISETWPLTVYGTACDRETGELRAKWQDKKIVVTQHTATGHDYDVLNGLCIRFWCDTVTTAESLAKIFGRICPWQACAAVEKGLEVFCQKQRLSTVTAGSHYVYLPLSQEADAVDYLNCIPMEYKANLWKMFLEEGLCPLELDWLYSKYQEGQPVCLIEWELALQSALEELHYHITNENSVFTVCDGSGDRRVYDYNDRNIAVKMFLKILFPVGRG